MKQPLVIACHDCDLLLTVPTLPDGGRARCPRCGAEIYSRKKNSLERTLSLVIAGIILFCVANAFPLLELKNQGLAQKTTLFQGVTALYDQNMQGLAFLVFITCIAAPLFQLAGLFYTLAPIKCNRLWPLTPLVFRFVRLSHPWSMMEVFMLGILVSIVKLAKMASIVPGVSLYAFAMLIFVLAWAAASLDPHLVWERVEAASP